MTALAKARAKETCRLIFMVNGIISSVAGQLHVHCKYSYMYMYRVTVAGHI